MPSCKEQGATSPAPPSRFPSIPKAQHKAPRDFAKTLGAPHGDTGSPQLPRHFTRLLSPLSTAEEFPKFKLPK